MNSSDDVISKAAVYWRHRVSPRLPLVGAFKALRAVNTVDTLQNLTWYLCETALMGLCLLENWILDNDWRK